MTVVRVLCQRCAQVKGCLGTDLPPLAIPDLSDAALRIVRNDTAVRLQVHLASISPSHVLARDLNERMDRTTFHLWHVSYLTCLDRRSIGLCMFMMCRTIHTV